MPHRHSPAAVEPPATGAGRGPSSTGSRNGFLVVALVLAVAACLVAPAGATAAGAHGKRHPDRGWHGYGFLPGYQPPEIVEWERMRSRPPTYWYGGPHFYKGRWNGGGFGPCWTATPIGPHWNCG